MPETPRRVRDKVDTTIDGLNARWNLQLPRLHGPTAQSSEGQHSLARKCSFKIRYLCFRPVNLERLTDEFDVKARQLLLSKWVWKPSQERGTIPALQVTKSLVEPDLRSKIKDLQHTDRQTLLKLLDQVIDDDYQLALTTDAYERKDGPPSGPPSAAPTSPITNSRYHTPRQSPTRTRTRRSKELPEVAGAQLDEPQIKETPGKSAKRSLTSPSKNAKRQQTIPACFERSTSAQSIKTKEQPPPASFDTVQSGRDPSVFSHSERDGADIRSADTSMVESDSQNSLDLGYTQELAEVMENPDFQRSFTESGELSRSIDGAYLKQNPPFRVRKMLPKETPFWWSWEIHRAADNLGMVPYELNTIILERLSSDKTKSLRFWDILRSVCIESQSQNVLQKSELPDWMVTSNQYYQNESNKVISFKGHLEWSKDISKGLFDFKLNPLQTDQSCRFQRKFGADRFLVISSPILAECPLAKDGTPINKQTVHQTISEWLARTPHYIAGRYWRVVHIDQDKPKKRRKGQKESPRLKWFLFAQSGLAIEPGYLRDLHSLKPSLNPQHWEIKLEDLLDWHMPISDNRDSTDLKLFSRLALGFSKTIPTITLKREQFIFVPDTLGVARSDGTRKVMNDGCARISLALARAIWKDCGGTNIYDVPSVVQGRIGGAKGLWIVDYENHYADRGLENDFWIEVSESQLKIKPHPAHRLDADETQRTFEVLKHSGPTKEGHLNLQLITVLENGGVPRSVLENALVADTDNFSNNLMEAMHDPQALRLWIQEFSPSPKVENTSLLGSFPSEKADQVNMLLDAGFEPESNAMVVDGCQKILSNYLTDYVERLRIKVPHSTVVYCAPDPLGILQPGEVYLGFSQPIVDPRTGFYENNLIDLKVLLARNPAYLASDIQLRTAVYDHRLRHYKNVILFSTQGETPLASLLSGGDYDGDTVSVIWDPKIVEHFHNVDNLPKLPCEGECRLINKSRPLSTIFRGRRGRADDDRWEDFLQGSIHFNSSSNLMGKCSSAYETLVYHLSLKRLRSKLSDVGVLKLAALAGYLVDANKQGWLLEDQAWYSLKAETLGKKHLYLPAYKDASISPNYHNVIDFIKFSVAENQKSKTSAAFNIAHPTSEKYDHELSVLWKKYAQQASLEAAKNSSFGNRRRGSNSLTKLIFDDEQSLNKKIQQLDEEWRILRSRSKNNNNNSSFYKSQSEAKDFGIAIDEINQKFRAIEPSPSDHWICLQHKDGETSSFSTWCLLRASCLYYQCSRRGSHFSWIWHVAGPELCFLKARKDGRPRIVQDKFYRMLKVDSKFSRRLLEKQAEDMDVGNGRSFVKLEEDDENYDD